MSKHCEKMEANISTIDTTLMLTPKNEVDFIEHKIYTQCYTVAQKHGASPAWNTFYKIINECGLVLNNYVYCKHCKKVFCFKKSTSNLLKHKCVGIAADISSRHYKEADVSLIEDKQMEYVVKCEPSDVNVDIEMKKQITDAVVNWAIEDCRSFAAVERSGFKNLISTVIDLGTKYGNTVNVKSLLPNPTTISRDISALYQEQKPQITSEIISAFRIGGCVSCDLRADPFSNLSYLTVTISYIIDTNLIDRALAIISMKTEKATGENILKKISTVLNDFCIFEMTDLIYITEKGSNLKKALKDFTRINCSNHLLSNCVEKAIQNTPELLPLIEMVKKLSKFLNKMGMSPESPTDTQWNKLFHMVKSVDKHWTDIIRLLDQRKEDIQLDISSRSSIRSLYDILLPIDDVTKKMEGTTHPTLHFVYSSINHLKQKFTNVSSNETVEKMKKKIIFQIDNLWIKNLNVVHRVALFLFPPGNKMTIFTPEEKEEVRMYIVNKIKEITAKFGADIFHTPSEDHTESINPPSQSTLEFFTGIIVPAPSPETAEEKEIERYSNSEYPLSENFDLLKWWEMHKYEYKYLYFVAVFIFSIPASSAASERVFADCGNLITEKRSEISEECINNIAVLHSNNKIEQRKL